MITSYFIVSLSSTISGVSLSSSSTGTSRTSAIRSSIWASGTENPFSHLETVCLTTLKFFARCSCESFFAFRNCFNLSLSMSRPPLLPFYIIRANSRRFKQQMLTFQRKIRKTSTKGTGLQCVRKGEGSRLEVYVFRT